MNSLIDVPLSCHVLIFLKLHVGVASHIFPWPFLRSWGHKFQNKVSFYITFTKNLSTILSLIFLPTVITEYKPSISVMAINNGGVSALENLKNYSIWGSNLVRCQSNILGFPLVPPSFQPHIVPLLLTKSLLRLLIGLARLFLMLVVSKSVSPFYSICKFFCLCTLFFLSQLVST